MSNNTESTKNASVVIAILVVIMAAAWLGYAYYKGPNYKTADGGNILLLHTIVPVALVVLLLKLRRIHQVKDAIYGIIALIITWIFIKFLSILMPFLLGFGFAYLFHFFIESMQDIPLPKGKRLQLSKGWARVLTGVIVICIVAILALYMIPQIIDQASEMRAGIQDFYNDTLVPFVVGTQIPIQSLLYQPEEPSVLIAGTYNGIHKSTDSGTTWTRISKIGQETTLSIHALASSPAAPNTLFAGTNKGLYKSEDFGVRWTQIEDEALGEENIQTLLLSTNAIYASNDKGNIYKSEAVGKGWAEISKMGVSVNALSMHPEAPNVIYAGTSKGIYKSEDDGDTWAEVISEEMQGKEIRALLFPAETPTVFYAASAQNIYKSEDNGVMWVNISKEGSFPKDTIRTLSLHPKMPTMLYAGSAKGIYKSVDAGTKWTRIDEGKPGLLDKLEETESPFIEELVNKAKRYIKDEITTLAQKTAEIVGITLTRISQFLVGSIGFIGTAFLTMMVFIYAAKSFGEYMEQLKNLFPEKQRTIMIRYASEIDNNMRSFLRGQFLVIFILGIISVVVYGIIGVPFFMVVGILAGICNAIPTFGPLIGGGFAFLALLTGFAAGQYSFLEIWPPGFLFRGLMLLGAIFLIQALDNSLISPRVMSKAVDVDPLVITFSVLIGAAVLGFWGVILAIPIVVIIKSVVTVSRELKAVI